MGLSKLLKQASGVFVDSDRIVVTVAAATPTGPRKVETYVETLQEPDEPGALARTLRALHEASRLPGVTVVGIDPRRDFCVTRRLEAEEQDLAPSELLGTRLGRVEGGVVTGAVPVKLPSGPHVTLLAGPRAFAAEALAGLEERDGARNVLLPVVPQLHRLAVRSKKAPRKWRTNVRVMRHEAMALAILSGAGAPLAWRLFDWSDEKPLRPLEVTLRSLHAHARTALGLDRIDGAVLHLGDEAEALAGSFEEAAGVPAMAAPALCPDAETSSFALAVAGLSHRKGALNLFADLIPAAGFRDNFPKAAAALLTGLVAVSGWMLHGKASDIERVAGALDRQAATNARKVRIQMHELDKHHRALKLEVELAEAFIVDRVLWAPLLREVPDLVPETMTLTELDGRASLAGFGSKKRKSKSIRRVTLQGDVPFAGGDSSPPEVARLTGALNASPAFSQSFPVVTGATVRRMSGGSEDIAKILVMCVPRGQ